MPVEIALIFKSVSLGLGAAKYLGIIEDKLAAKLDQLAGSEFEAGMRALQQASEAEREQQSLLREARSRFNRAISLEKGLRLALAHLGLALCHWHLGDRANAKRSLTDLIAVQPPSVPLAGKVAEKVANAPWWLTVLLPGGNATKQLAPIAAEMLKREVMEEQGRLSELQQSANSFLNEV